MISLPSSLSRDATHIQFLCIDLGQVCCLRTNAFVNRRCPQNGQRWTQALRLISETSHASRSAITNDHAPSNCPNPRSAFDRNQEMFESCTAMDYGESIGGEGWSQDQSKGSARESEKYQPEKRGDLVGECQGRGEGSIGSCERNARQM